MVQAMDAESVLAVAAGTGGVVMGLAPLLQLRRIRERGHADDVSITFLLIIAAGAAVWMAYGFALPNLALILPNVVAVATNLATALTAARFRSAPATAGSARGA
jgi:uncharacterized protein with PQ loop repeat